SEAMPYPAIWRIVQVRPRYIVGYGPRTNGYWPGNPSSSYGRPTTSSGVYTRLSGSPEALRHSDIEFGWRLLNAASSFSSQSRRIAAICSIARASNMLNPLGGECGITDCLVCPLMFDKHRGRR